MYFPPEKEPVPQKCPGCGKWYIIPNGPRFVCAVMHAPGTCCHMGEKEVPEPAVPDVVTQ